MQASCLFWPLYKWFLAVCPSLLMPDLRQMQDCQTSIPIIILARCHYYCKPALEEIEAKSDRVPPPHLLQLHIPALCSVPRKFTQAELCLCQALTNFRCQIHCTLCCVSSWFFKRTTSYQKTQWCWNTKARQQTLGVGTQILFYLSILIPSVLPRPFWGST